MPERIVVAYLLIAFMVVIVAAWLLAWRRQMRAERRLRRGGSTLSRRVR